MKRAIRIGLIVLAALIVVGIALPFLVDVNAFRPRLESELTTALGRQVKMGNLSLSIFSGSVTAENISIADDPAFSKDAFITAKSLRVGVELIPLIFSKTLHVTGIALEQPQITLLSNAQGNWNFSTIGGKSPAATGQNAGEPSGALSVDKLSVSDGRLLIGTANSTQKPAAYEKVDVEVSDFAPTRQFPFTLSADPPGGGELKLKGKAGPINSGNTEATPFEAALSVRKLNLASSGLVQPSTGIQGIADFDGTISSNGQDVKTNGTLKAEKLKLAEKGAPSPKPVELKYSTNYNIKGKAGALTQGDVSIGKAVAHLTGTYHVQSQTTTLSMKLNGDNMPVDELEAALPAVGVVLPSGSKLQGGTITTALAIAGPTTGPVITGPIRLSNSKLAGFDMGSKLSAVSALSGRSTGGKDTTIQNLSADLRSAPEGTQANNINLTIPALGVVTGAGTISPSGGLNFKMTANLSGGVAGGAMQKAGLGGGSSVPFAIQGTTADPKFVPDVGAMAGSAIQQAVSSKVPGAKGASPASSLGGLFGKKKK